MRFKSIDGKRTKKIYPFKQSSEKTTEEVMEWINSFGDGSIVAGHNILGYDTWMLWKFLGIKPVVGKMARINLVVRLFNL